MDTQRRLFRIQTTARKSCRMFTVAQEGENCQKDRNKMISRKREINGPDADSQWWALLISGRRNECVAKPGIKVHKKLSFSPFTMMLIKYLLCARLCMATGNATLAINQCHSSGEMWYNNSASTTQLEGLRARGKSTQELRRLTAY